MKASRIWGGEVFQDGLNTQLNKVFLRKNCDKKHKLYQAIQRCFSSKFLPKRQSLIG